MMKCAPTNVEASAMPWRNNVTGGPRGNMPTYLEEPDHIQMLCGPSGGGDHGKTSPDDCAGVVVVQTRETRHIRVFIGNRILAGMT